MSEFFGVETERVAELRRIEQARFEREHPKCLSWQKSARRCMPHGVPMVWMAEDYMGYEPVVVREGSGAWFECLDGVRFLETADGDMSTFCGLNPEPVVRAVCDRAARGWQFLLPVPEAREVAEELARRWPHPYWQFTLSATQANVEAIRVARHFTGRSKFLTMVGNYAGHSEELLVSYSGGTLRLPYLGLSEGVERGVGLVQFNDVKGLEAALATREYACFLCEPTLTNVGIVMPESGWHDALRRLTRETGTVLVLDEAHTCISGPGGLVRRWDLEPDIVTCGKSLGGGLPLGAYGMTEEVAEAFESGHDHTGTVGELATGGTLFGNGLSLAASLAALTQVLTDDAYERAAALGSRLADGLEATIARAGLPWKAHRLYPRSGVSFPPQLPRDAAEADASEGPELRSLLHVALANRGVWEGTQGTGPTVSVAFTESDVDHYVAAFGEFIDELVA